MTRLEEAAAVYRRAKVAVLAAGATLDRAAEARHEAERVENEAEEVLDAAKEAQSMAAAALHAAALESS